MLLAFARPARAHWRSALLCLLLLGLLLHGHAGVLRQLLGAAHWHSVPAAQALPDKPRAGWLQAMHGWRQQLQSRSPLIAGHALHAHHHDGLQRHHHGPQDASVASLQRAQAADTGAQDAASGSLLQPLALATGPGWCPPAAGAVRWSTAAAPGWRDAGSRLPERPPRA